MSITVAELIKELAAFDPSLPVRVTWEGQAKEITAADLYLSEGDRPGLHIDGDFGY